MATTAGIAEMRRSILTFLLEDDQKQYGAHQAEIIQYLKHDPVRDTSLQHQLDIMIENRHVKRDATRMPYTYFITGEGEKFLQESLLKGESYEPPSWTEREENSKYALSMEIADAILADSHFGRAKPERCTAIRAYIHGITEEFRTRNKSMSRDYHFAAMEDTIVKAMLATPEFAPATTLRQEKMKVDIAEIVKNHSQGLGS